jgi:hypothetical protein
MKLLVPVFALLLLSCATLRAAPHLSAAEAVQIADADARSHHYDLREFLPRKATYSPKDDSWFISYRQKKSAVAFDVQLHDKTKKIQTTFICSWP